jgi:putative endonuclease
LKAAPRRGGAAPATNFFVPHAGNLSVYVLQNREGKFYVGLSDDVARRIEQHNSGSRWTKGKGPWKLVWQSDYLSLADARKLENRLKRQGPGKGFYTITRLHRASS